MAEVLQKEAELDSARIVAAVFGVKKESVHDSKEMRKALRTLVREIAMTQEKTMKAVMIRSFGFTQKRAGEVLDCTRDRIRQWEGKGYRLLRARCKVLMPFVDDL